MKTQHVKWALSHDWCKGAEITAEGIAIQINPFASDTGEDETKVFPTFQALREWAGY